MTILEKIKKLVKEYYIQEHYQQKEFDPQKDSVKYAGRIFDHQELTAAVEASLEFWLTEGKWAKIFTKKIKDYLGVKNVILTNSGSSANLLAISALTSKKLGERRLRPSDEVISVAASFPSTITPIIQNNLVPVLVDIDLKTYNVNIEALKRAISPKSKAIFLAHTLGNPFNLKEVKKLAQKYNLWLIEDNCDSLGSKYDGKYTGTFGDISTLSFYPAHHITCGEGGAVITDNKTLAKIITSLRDWGRDCHCLGGESDNCGKRFKGQFGNLPAGYDHKYVYSELGYNLKMTDWQAAIGQAQMDKLPTFTKARKDNFVKYIDLFKKYEEYFLLPTAAQDSEPSWFSFMLSLKEDAPFSRNQFVSYLNDKKVETRNIFAGNIIKQPAFIDLNIKVVGSLINSDFVMNNSFFLGTYPGLNQEMFSYLSCVVNECPLM